MTEQRKMMSLEQNMEIISRPETGEVVLAI
jgi:hypothetical protein